MTRVITLIVLIATIGCEMNNPTPAPLPRTSKLNPGEPQTAKNQSLPLKLPGIDGREVNPFDDQNAKGFVVIFVCTYCPIANRYAPEVIRLYEAYQPQGVGFWLVYADPSESADTIRKHLVDYQYQIPAVQDPDHHFVDFCNARKTPEAVVFSADHQQVYRGRIDDRFTDYGKSRAVASQHDLQDAIDAMLAGKTVETPVTDVIGCHIPGVDE